MQELKLIHVSKQDDLVAADPVKKIMFTMFFALSLFSKTDLVLPLCQLWCMPYHIALWCIQILFYYILRWFLHDDILASDKKLHVMDINEWIIQL